MPVRKTNVAGSSNALRGDVLRVLGVVKAATTDQIQRAAAPHLTYRHTTKPTPSARKTARTAAHTAALTDLRTRGLVETAGRSSTGEAIRTLTPAGLQAAAYELHRPLEEMGGTARRAAAAGGSHPLAVTEAVLALLRPCPDVGLVTDEPADAVAAAQAAADAPPGLGTLGDYATEVPLPVSGTWARPGHGGVQADLVLTASQDGLPLLFVEVDNCHMTAQQLAAKVDRYARFFQRRVKDTDGRDREMWRTRWPSPARTRDAPHPPLLLVFNRLGPRNPVRTVQTLADLTRPHWAPLPARGYGRDLYSGKIPLLVTTLDHLRTRGPNGAVFHRIGRSEPQRLLDAVDHADEAAQAIRAAEEQDAAQRRALEREAEDRRAAEREARRPTCGACARPFTDERWVEVSPTGWQNEQESHPRLCSLCKPRAIQAEAEAEAERERQEHSSRGWLSRRLRP